MVAVLNDSMETSGEQLMKDFRKGLNEAMTSFWNKFSQDLIQYSMKFTRDEHASQDIVTDGYLKLWNERKEFENEDHVKRWLFTVIRHQSIKHTKESERQQISLKELGYLNNPITENDFFHTELMGMYSQLMNLLTPRQREIIYALVVEGTSNKEIAERLNINVKTLYKQRNEALDMMQKYAVLTGWKYPALLPYLMTLIELARQSQH